MTTSPPETPAARFGPALVVAVLSGAFIAGQGRLNGDLASAGTGTMIASWLSYVGTFATIALVLAVMGRLGGAVRLIRTRGAWWWFAIGLCGIPIVIAMTVGIPVIGVALASVCSVAGQTVSGLLLDARGIGLPEPIKLSLRRIGAGVWAVLGLAVAVWSSPVPAESIGPAIGMGLALFAGGFILCGQQSGNGAVAAIAGDPLIPGLTSVIGGLIGISILTGAMWATGTLGPVAYPDPIGSWWLYLGGPFGAVITVAAAWAVRVLGTFALTLAIVGGQLATAVVLDLIGDAGVGPLTFVAIGAIAASVLLAIAPRRAPAEPLVP